jgi:hypothetical protein
MSRGILNNKNMPNGDKKIKRKYARAEKKIAAAKTKSPKKTAKVEKKYGYRP